MIAAYEKSNAVYLFAELIGLPPILREANLYVVRSWDSGGAARESDR